MRPEMSLLMLLSLLAFLSAVSAGHPQRENNLRTKPEPQLSYVRPNNDLYYEEDEDEPARGYWNNTQTLWNNSYTFMTKVSNYISKYSSSTLQTWFTYPWYNPSGGLTALIICMSLLYGWILVSGWTITNGRSLDSWLDQGELSRLTHAILQAIDRMNGDFGTKRSGSLSNELKDETVPTHGKPQVDRGVFNWGASSSGPTWSTSVTQASSWSGYISTILYNYLNWMAKPYPGFIASLGAIAILMIVHVIIAMTGGVFPSTVVSGRVDPPLGKKPDAEEKRAIESSRVAHGILEAIDLWAQRNRIMKE